MHAVQSVDLIMHSVHSGVNRLVGRGIEMRQLVKAVRNLRARLGDSQQAFANRLGVSIRAVANYEKDREATGKALLELKNLADGHGVIEVPPDKKEDFDALMAILFGGGKQNREALAEWNKLSEPIKAANRARNFRASANLGLHKEVRRRISVGESDDDIVLGLPAWQPDIVRAFVENLRGLDRLSETSRKGKK
jgi:transcriptional regulator with XRE-family HTH domain